VQQGRESLILKAVEITVGHAQRLYQKNNPSNLAAALKIANLQPRDVDLFSVLFQYRDVISKLTDKKPDEVISPAVMKLLIVKSPQTQDALDRFLAQHHVTLGGNSKGLLRVLNEGEAFFNNTQCHNCTKYGHCAKQCTAPKVKDAEQQWLKEHPEVKQQKNRKMHLSRQARRKAQKSEEWMKAIAQLGGSSSSKL